MELHITLDKPTKEEIMKAYYAIVNTKANNEDTFINDGGRRSFRSSNDKKVLLMHIGHFLIKVESI